ncbi:MAG TPA: hypothetical protein VER12_06460 [Polyangiaceae bacterium]|nr:hypothetical protein [Polyangiaceae bacterium]
MAQRAGLLLRRDGELAFLPASVARWLLPLPRLTKLPWDSAQMALVGGEVVAVLALAEPSAELLLCELDGQAVAISGLSAERVGFWPASGSGISVDGVLVPALDLSEALERFRSDRPAPQEEPP